VLSTLWQAVLLCKPWQLTSKLYIEGNFLRLSVSCKRSISSSFSPRVGICEMAVSERSLEHRDTWLQPSCAKEKQNSNKTIAHSHQQRRNLTLPCTKFLSSLLLKQLSLQWLVSFSFVSYARNNGRKHSPFVFKYTAISWGIQPISRIGENYEWTLAASLYVLHHFVSSSLQESYSAIQRMYCRLQEFLSV